MKERPIYTIAEAFASYLVTNSPKKTASSQKIDKRVLAIAQWFFEKELGLSLMSDVTVEALERFEIWASEPQKCGVITKDAWSTSSIMRHGKTLKSIFRKAFLTGRIERDPSALWKLSSDSSEERRPMTDAEFDRLLELAPAWFLPILKTLGATGARGSSLARLRWKDVDFASETLYFTSRKGAARREKRIPFPLFEQLREILSTIPSYGAEFVFLKDGHPVSGPLISMTGHRLIKAAGFHGVVLYGIRHKFATDLLTKGISTELARRLMGHSNEAMLKKYSAKLGIGVLGEAVTSIRGKK